MTVYDSATGLPTAKRMPRNPAGGDASETKTIYYKADAPAGWDGDCVNRPEWASMPCKVAPAAQPGTQGLPDLPVTTYTYNRLGQAATETEKVGSTTRVTTQSYQDVGRPFANTAAVASPARAGLVAAYSFDEGAGTTITDLSGHNNSGSFSGATWNTGGKFGGALSFDGVNDAAWIADTASLNLSKGMTLEAWVKPSAASGKRTIIAKQHPTGLSYGLYSNTTSSGPAAEGPATASSNTSLGTGTWKHVAATYDGTTLKLYVNGGLVASQATTANMSANAGPLGIGGHDFGGEYFQGLIDEVRIYDRALSGPEVLFDQNTAVSATADVAGSSGNAPEDERLAAGYDFEEGTGSKAVFDMSGNGNDAQPSGSASPSWVTGLLTPLAMSFDGVDDELVMGDNESLDLRKPISIDGWVKLDALPAAGKRMTILSKAGSYYLQINSSGQLVFGIDPTGSEAFLPANELAGPGPAVGTWTYVAAVFTGTYMMLYKGTYPYINQVAQKTFTAITAAATAAPLQIGNYTPLKPPMTTALLDGTLDQLRLSNRTLSPTEIVGGPRPYLPGAAFSTNAGGVEVGTVSRSYNSTNGRLAQIASTSPTGATTTNITAYDTVGRITSYTDAAGVKSTTTYDIVGRAVTTDDGKGTQTRTYNDKSGLLTGLVDSLAGSFGATYDPNGQIVSQTYPGGLTATTTYDETGAASDLSYAKGGVWFEDHVKESVHGQWLERDSSLSDQQYAYDNAGRLTQVQDRPTGQGCSTRSYGYDADSNRESKNTWAPGAGGACTTASTPTTVSSTNDSADRTTNTGFSYDSLGRITTIPATHAGGEPLQTTYYANDMVRSQTQGSTTQTWLLDVDKKRYRAAAPYGPSQEILHYDDPSDSPSWTETIQDGTVLKTDRNVEGIGGSLVATVSNSTTTLQLANLHGDIVATGTSAGSSPSATFETDEFGVPRSPSSRRYGWLGGKQRATRLSGGSIQMGRRSYVPTMGRFTSVDPVDGGSASSYDYGNADPVNNLDLGGASYGHRNGHCGRMDPKHALRARCGLTCDVNVSCNKNSGTLNRMVKRCAEGFGFGYAYDFVSALARGKLHETPEMAKRAGRKRPRKMPIKIIRVGYGGCVVDALRGK